MAIDFKTFGAVVGYIADAHHPVLIRGRHGVGKSETVYQFAKKVGKRVVERRASQMTEGDLVGLPVVDNDRTSWNPPDWFKDACDNGVVLFMDEIDRAVQEVRQGFFQLTDSRTINGHRLHPDTLIFAAVNGGVNGAQYAVQDMDPAELDRWTVFDVEPSVEDWLQFAKDSGVSRFIVDFITDNHSHLEHKGEFEPNKKYPSRRSWMRLNDTLQRAKLLEGDTFKNNLVSAYNVANGFLGFEAAVALKDYLDKYEKQVSVEDIIVDGKMELLKGFKQNDHLALIDKIVGSGRLTPAMPKAQMDNLARYLLKLPSECAMKMYTSISEMKGVDSTKFIIAFHSYEVDDTKVKDYMKKILGINAKKQA